MNIPTEYYSQILPSTTPIVDRERERKRLQKDCTCESFYIQGLPYCGKTELIKYIAKKKYEKGYSVFWHTIREQNSKNQVKTFLLSLNRHFLYKNNDKSIENYLENYGHLNINEKLFDLLKKYHPIIIIDDIHKCDNEDKFLKLLFEELIKKSICTIYFSGWFNIFDNLIVLQKLIMINLGGMKENFLCDIIYNNTKQRRPDIAKEIYEKHNGYPGFASIVRHDTSIEVLSSKHIYLQSFIDSLEEKELIAMLALAYVSIPINNNYFSNHNLLEAIYSLEYKKLVIRKGNTFEAYDTYRIFLKDYPINNSILEKVFIFLQSLILKEAIVALDLINVYIKQRKYKEAYEILSSNFKQLIHAQFEKALMKHLQDIEKFYECTEIFIQKITLHERLRNYDLCLNYISIVIGDYKEDISTFIELLYLKMRCCYFLNRYNKIVELYVNNVSDIWGIENNQLKTQIMLLIGRVFYIWNNLDISLHFYLLSFQLTEKKDKTLRVKIIYRIAMIESAKGLYIESLNTFIELLKQKRYSTSKRRSYLYNKIARGYYLINSYEEAINYNNESLKIKESYGDKRGIIFCKKLQALISYKKNNFEKALLEIEDALMEATLLNLHKEQITINLDWIMICLSNNKKHYRKLGKEKLIECLNIATKENLSKHIDKILNLSQDYYPDLKEQIINNLNTVQENIKNKSIEVNQKEFFSLNEKNSNLYNQLVFFHESISKKLLILSQFI